jgi:hypothetical protein
MIYFEMLILPSGEEMRGFSTGYSSETLAVAATTKLRDNAQEDVSDVQYGVEAKVSEMSPMVHICFI